jgi:hypothetical protein
VSSEFASDAAELARVDVFGSAWLDRDSLIRNHGARLIELIRAGDAGDDAGVEPLVAALERDLSGPNVALAQASLVTYFRPRRCYLTIDVVDACDRARRMVFDPAPTTDHADPGGLIARWRAYEARVFELLRADALADEEPCPFWHCLNNAMRVLATIANEHHEVAIPLEPIVVALDHPLTTDRNKAAAILDGLSRHDDNKPIIRARAGTTLVAMLALRQPNNHDIAYTILKTISGRDFGPRDVEAWRSWLRTARDCP